MMVPTITTERLILRAVRPDDFEPYFEQILSDGAVMQWLGGDGQPRERESAKVSFARLADPERDERDGFWVAVDRASGQLIGHVVLQRLDKSDLIEVGYALGRRWWGAGLATEAARALVDYGFSVLRLDLITGVARPANAASRRVLEKAGLTYAGERHYYGLDLAFYELTKSAWERR